MPPLAEDSEEFGGFEPSSGSTFVSNGLGNGGNNGNFGGASFTPSGVSGSSNNVNGNRLSSFSGNNAGSSLGVRVASPRLTNVVASSGVSNSATNGNGFVKGLGNGATSDGDYKILRQEGDINEDGYHYLYETENKIQAEETGRVLNKGTDDAHIEATGYFEYVGPDGITYRVDYTADENGFHPTVSYLSLLLLKP